MSTKWLYVTNYWDGPLDGMVTHGGRLLWAHYSLKYNGGFDLWHMPDAWMAEEAEQHSFWNECSGNYSYDLPEGHKPTRPFVDFHERYPPGSRKGPAEIDGAVLVTTVNEHTIKYPERKTAMAEVVVPWVRAAKLWVEWGGESYPSTRERYPTLVAAGQQYPYVCNHPPQIVVVGSKLNGDDITLTHSTLVALATEFGLPETPT